MFRAVKYADLNSRQKENYNFQKVASHLADYGFNCLRLTDDWQGADFIACHVDGETFLKVQLKARLSIDRKYIGKNIHIAFMDDVGCYVYPHDEVVSRIEAAGSIGKTSSWRDRGIYNWPSIPKWVRALLEEYKV